MVKFDGIMRDDEWKLSTIIVIITAGILSIILPYLVLEATKTHLYHALLQGAIMLIGIFAYLTGKIKEIVTKFYAEETPQEILIDVREIEAAPLSYHFYELLVVPIVQLVVLIGYLL